MSAESIREKVFRLSYPKTCEDFIAFAEMADDRGTIHIDGDVVYCHPTVKSLADISRRIIALEAAR